MSTATSSAAPTELAAQSSSDRVLSIDVIRGLTILLMIFVNDVGAVTGAFPFIKHYYGDGMMLPDIVFPAFLFIVGMSIPMAFSKRLSQTSSLSLLSHILIRSFSLLALGVLTVAGPTDAQIRYLPWSDQLVGWWPGLWSLCMYLSAGMVWHWVKTDTPKRKKISLAVRIVGGIFLIYLISVFRRDGLPMQPRWWGILGLIGWAYLVCSLLYLIVRNNRLMILGCTALLYCIYIMFRTGNDWPLIANTPGDAWLWTPSFNGKDLWFSLRMTGETIGSQAAITMTGILLGTLFTADSDIRTPVKRVKFALTLAAMLALAGMMLDPLYGINKPTATLTWCLYCSAITAAAWAILYIIIDIGKFKKWCFIVGPAGSNPLFAYLLAPVAYKLETITFAFTTPNRYTLGAFNHPSATWFGSTFNFIQPWTGITKSIIFAFLIIALTGFIAKRGFRLKL